jgi:regulator of replication initiation timing
MPLPIPHEDESKDDFVSRCMSDDILLEEYPDENQRLAICHSQFEKTFEERKVYDIDNVEIFKAGIWNGHSFSEKDIDDIVKSFNDIGSEIKPYIKLGHDDKQKLLQKDGYPSAGWIVSLRKNGGKLLASFRGIPEKIYKLIKKKAYGRFSAEIYHNLTIGNKKYPYVLKAVSLLGADTPAVEGLDDFIDLYTENNYRYDKIILYDEVYNMGELEELQKKVAQMANDMDGLQKANSELIKENDVIKNENMELNRKAEEQIRLNREAEIQRFMNDMVKEGKVLPSQVDYFVALCMNSDVLTFTNSQNQKIEGSSLDLVKQIIENNDVNKFSENSEKGKSKDMKYSDMDDEEKDEYLDKEIKKYCRENKVDYIDAYQIVLEKLEEEGE